MCRLSTLRPRWRRYAASAGIVAAALLLVGASELVFGTARFFIVASSIALSVVLFGLGAGLFALLWAILLSDFFLIPPAFAFNMDGLSLRVAGEIQI
jgi:K+-sensing histidine kinase KdpD